MNTISRRIQSCFEQPKKDAPILCNFSVSPNAPLRKADRRMASHRLGISKVKEWFSMRRISMTFCSMPQQKLDLSKFENVDLIEAWELFADVKPSIFASPVFDFRKLRF